MARKHYMTLNFRNNTEVTHIQRDIGIVVTFEQAVTGGFYSCDFLLNGTLVNNTGFNQSDLQFFKSFVVHNAPVIAMESRGEI